MRSKAFCTVALLVMLVGICPVSVEAYTTVVDGIEVTVEMDQELYEEEDPITVTIIVTNQREETVVIASLEQLIPEGYVLTEESQAIMENFELSSGESRQLTAVLESMEQPQQEEEAMDFLDILLEGETWGIPNLLLLLGAIVLIVVFGILT